MTLMILGLLILIAGIVLLVVKKKKKLGTVLLVLGLLATVIGFLWVGTGMGDDETDSDTDKMIEADSFIEVPSMDGIKADEDKITFDASYASISIEPDDAGEDLAPGESPSALHPEDKIEGVTGDGIAWSTDKRDGTGTIHLNVNGKPVSATVKPKADEKSGSRTTTIIIMQSGIRSRHSAWFIIPRSSGFLRLTRTGPLFLQTAGARQSSRSLSKIMILPAWTMSSRS